MAQLLRICFSIILAWSAGLTAATAQKADPALFGALPSIDMVEISPDGKTVGLLQNSNGQSTVVFFDLDNPNATPNGVIVGAVKARSLQWVGNDHLLLLASDSQNLGSAFNTSGQTRELFRWISISKETRELKMLFRQDAGYYVPSPGNILATTPESPNDAVFARWTPDARAPSTPVSVRLKKRDIGDGYSLFNVNVETGREKITYRGKSDTYDWIVDENGEAILRIDFNERTDERKIYRRRPNGRTFDHLITYKAEYGSAETVSYYGLGETSNEILATGYNGQDTIGLSGFNLDTGVMGRTIFRDDKYDITSIYYDADTATATTVYYTDDFPRAHHLNPDDQRLQDSLGQALPGAVPYITSKSQNGEKLIIRAVYADRPTDIYLFDKPTRNLAFFSSTRPAIADKIYAQKTKFDYTSADGLEIDGYLTIPAGKDAKNLPLIVLPHGGPESRDTQSFDWWAFFYAARGYAVYQPNFRGSFGYGLKFREAGYGEWGRKMQSDITNGVQKLIDDGLADPERICIIGGSYGGYAALAGATLTPNLYACAVSVNGVSDLPTMIGAAALQSSLGAEYWEKRIGSRFRDSNELAAVSPKRRVTSATAPIMLIHGRDDTVVNFEQSEIMRDALVAANKPVEFIELEGEDHWLSFGQTRIEMLQRSIEFIDRHIGGE
ncbi:MAG: S9 family peptidase [Pseudomonadota bacterium]